MRGARFDIVLVAILVFFLVFFFSLLMP